MNDRQLEIGGIDPYTSLKSIAFMSGDPCCHLQPGKFERATWTPDGPGSLRVTWTDGTARVRAWGAGTDWLMEGAERFLGLLDNVSEFDPQDRVVRLIWSQHVGLRVIATHTVWHDLSWLIVQQRVASKAATQQWRAMVKAWGEPAPGDVDLLLPPAAALVASKPYIEFHPLGIERQRAEYLRLAANEIRRLDNIVGLTSDEADSLLQSVRGIGPWTAASMVANTLGDADAVIPGDYNLPSTVAWVLAREPRANDARMIELLAPFAGHRWRVCRLMIAAGLKAPRRGPRRRSPDIRRM